MPRTYILTLVDLLESCEKSDARQPLTIGTSPSGAMDCVVWRRMSDLSKQSSRRMSWKRMRPAACSSSQPSAALLLTVAFLVSNAGCSMIASCSCVPLRAAVSGR